MMDCAIRLEAASQEGIVTWSRDCAASSRINPHNTIGSIPAVHGSSNIDEGDDDDNDDDDDDDNNG